MKYIGIDLHTNSFTACYLEEGKPERIETFRLQDSSYLAPIAFHRIMADHGFESQAFFGFNMDDFIKSHIG